MRRAPRTSRGEPGPPGGVIVQGDDRDDGIAGNAAVGTATFRKAAGQHCTRMVLLLGSMTPGVVDGGSWLVRAVNQREGIGCPLLFVFFSL